MTKRLPTNSTPCSTTAGRSPKDAHRRKAPAATGSTAGAKATEPPFRCYLAPHPCRSRAALENDGFPSAACAPGRLLDSYRPVRWAVMRPWTFSAADVKAFSTEELAAHVLRDLDENQDARRTFTNIDSWRDRALQAYTTDLEAQRAVVEAVHWLRMKGLVMQDPSQSSPCFVYITKRGTQVLDDGLQRHQITERLDVGVNPALQPAKELYLQGRFDTAAFEAMKAVEVAVREAAKLGNDALGVTMMRTAFGKGGPLTDSAAEPGEQVAAMELFAGAIGTFKNPSSHRYVDFDDPTLAGEVIVLADLLLRLLDKRK